MGKGNYISSNDTNIKAKDVTPNTRKSTKAEAQAILCEPWPARHKAFDSR